MNKLSAIVLSPVPRIMLAAAISVALLFACEPNSEPPPSPPFETCMNFCVPYAGYRCVFYGLAGTWSHRNAVDACFWYCKYKTQSSGALPKESYQEWDSLQGDYSLDADGISRPKETTP